MERAEANPLLRLIDVMRSHTMNWRRGLHRLWGTLSVIWAAFMLGVVVYNYENLSATFGGLEGHPLQFVATADIIWAATRRLLGRFDLGLDRTRLQS
jgi:hypothetical protein